MNELLTKRQINGICKRMSSNLQVRRTLQGNGRLHIDRQLPFLLIYRKPEGNNDPALSRIAVSTASYLFVDGNKTWTPATAELAETIAKKMSGIFGDFLILEIWSSTQEQHSSNQVNPRPSFTLHHRTNCKLPETLTDGRESLSSIKILGQFASVETKVNRKCRPPQLSTLFSSRRIEELGISWLGLEIAPIYLDESSNEPYPLMVRALSRQVSVCLNKLFYSFAGECTTHQPPHYHMLGRKAMVKAVREVDQHFDDIGRSFDLLQLVTPINADKEWYRFQRRRFEVPPRFLYRPSPIDPGLLKAKLYSIRIDHVEDPTLMHLFLDKQRELDRQLTLVMERHRQAFLYESLQLFGKVSDRTIQMAKLILETFRARPLHRTPTLSASEILELAEHEISIYRQQCPTFSGNARINKNVYAGLLVSHGQLSIGPDASVPAVRADALIQHEVGTHVLTYSNGREQAFKMLSSGLPGYDALQEGLAVLAEYLAGGLDAARLRLLAVRVIAVKAMVEGATFIEVFRMLNKEHGFTQRSAYTVTMRVFRGGGLTKDAIYLKGLMDLLVHLHDGNPLDILFAGKFALRHRPVIEELILRNVLESPKVLPLYLRRSESQMRLKALSSGMSVTQLIGT